MLISYTVENWMSFREPVSLSMIAGRERQHNNRLAVIPGYKTRVLPVTALYGGNASGKSNFCKSLFFIQNYVVQGRRPGEMTRVEPFLLERSYSQIPTRFKLEILIEGTIFEYSFALTNDKVIEEKLIEVGYSGDAILYSRAGGEMTLGDYTQDEKEFLGFVFRSTRDNQLFLTSSIFNNSDRFRKVYDWFKNVLVIITPNSRYQPIERFFDESSPLAAGINEVLPGLDTGMGRICGESVSAESSLPQEIRDILQHELSEGKTHNVNVGEKQFIVTKHDGQLKVQRLVAYHKSREGEVRFEIWQESDGSRRLLDLLPAFLTMLNNNSQRVCLIDELDRSLHTLLTRQLLSGYLDNYKPESRCQLLFSTHDVLLMDQDLFRRDEMSVVERNIDGSSALITLCDYKDIRKDKDIRKSYLNGRFGGIPRLLLSGGLLAGS
ncbi:MAG: ATP-binding protein [Sedimentisphaerales bacterium]|nr:ATP-binding protein [Sedimentisphaerales bacterium]MBN2843193.1 ATP-binding protein [Sedimentisphaerales bacterium]